MSKHTKTPWRVFTSPDGTKLVGIGGQDGEGILDAGFGVWSWNDAEGIANANLVVKAVNVHDALVTELKLIADWRNVSLAGEYEHGLRDIIRSMLDCADRGLASIKEPS